MARNRFQVPEYYVLIRSIVFHWTSSSASRQTPLMDFCRRKLSLALWILGLGLALGLIWHGYQGGVLHKTYPYNTFLYNPDIRGSDFTVGTAYLAHQNPYRAGCNYFPAANFVFSFYSLLPHAIRTYLFLATTFLGLWSMLSLSLLKLVPHSGWRFATGALLMSTYPILLCLDRGNIEILVAFFVAAFCFCFARKRFLLGLCFLVPAICFKFYPVVLLLLFVRRRFLLWPFAAVAAFVLISLGGMLTYPDSVVESCRLLVDQFSAYNNRVNLDFNGYAASAGGWNCFRLAVFFVYSFGDWYWPMPPDMVKETLQCYSLIMACLGLYLAAHVVLVETTFARRAILLLLYMTVSAPGGADYKLMHVEIALVILLLVKERRPGDLWAVGALAFCLIPKKEVFLTFMGITDSIHADASIGIILNPLCVLLAMGLLVRSGYRKGTATYSRRHLVALTWPLRRLVSRPA